MMMLYKRCSIFGKLTKWIDIRVYAVWTTAYDVMTEFYLIWKTMCSFYFLFIAWVSQKCERNVEIRHFMIAGAICCLTDVSYIACFYNMGPKFTLSTPIVSCCLVVVVNAPLLMSPLRGTAGRLPQRRIFSFYRIRYLPLLESKPRKMWCTNIIIIA